MLSDEELAEKWKSTARVLYEEISPRLRDIVLIHSDLDQIDTLLEWKRLTVEAQRAWCNWVYRGEQDE